MLRYPMSRLILCQGAPDAESFEVYEGSNKLLQFVTGGINGKTALGTAVANLSDMSEWSDEALSLRAGRDGRLIATAVHGAVIMADDVESD